MKRICKYCRKNVLKKGERGKCLHCYLFYALSDEALEYIMKEKTIYGEDEYITLRFDELKRIIEYVRQKNNTSSSNNA